MNDFMQGKFGLARGGNGERLELKGCFGSLSAP